MRVRKADIPISFSKLSTIVTHIEGEFLYDYQYLLNTKENDLQIPILLKLFGA